MERIAVIGAGAAGLVSARELRRRGLAVVVFEAGPTVGGTWVYDDTTDDDPLGQAADRPRVHGSMYDGLRTNLPADLMAFSDYPLRTRARFPGHAAIARYLIGFARDFGVDPLVRLRAEVIAVLPRAADGSAWQPGRDEEAGWEVVCKDGTVQRFDAVVVANGHYSHPRIPVLPGHEAYAGIVLHSHNYRRPGFLAGLTVAVVGGGSSGLDLSREIASVARRVYWCRRDFDAAAARGPHHNIVRTPPISGLGPHLAVTMEGGTTVDPVDAVVLCTGYRYAFPFLPTEPKVVEVRDNWVHPLCWDLLSARASSVAFVGLPFKVVPFPQFEVQAKLLAALWTDAIPTPPLQARLEIAARHADQLRDVPARHRHRHGPLQYAYHDALARRCGAAPLPAWFAPLNEAVSRARRADPDGYRDGSLPGPFR